MSGFWAKEDTQILRFLFAVGLWGLHLMVSPRGLPGGFCACKGDAR